MNWISNQYGDFTDQSRDFVSHLRKGSGPYYSLDLTNRTDRFPISFQRKVFAKFFGKVKRERWIKILVSYPFEITGHQDCPSYVYYKRGQPMGAYSSWAMFTATHHLILQYVKREFPETVYAVLGDDVVIRGTEAANLYKSIMASLDVSISNMKTHVSDDTYEFMKQWIHKGSHLTPLHLNQLIQRGQDSDQLSAFFLNHADQGWWQVSADGHSQFISDYIKKVLKKETGEARYLSRHTLKLIKFRQWLKYETLSYLKESLFEGFRTSCSRQDKFRKASEQRLISVT